MNSEEPLVEGVVEGGVECFLVRGADGALFALSGPQARTLVVGERVRVYGEVMDLGHCMQGKPVNIRRLEILTR